LVGGLHVGQEGLLGEAKLHFRPEEDGVVQIGDGAFNGGGVSELPEILKNFLSSSMTISANKLTCQPFYNLV